MRSSLFARQSTALLLLLLASAAASATDTITTSSLRGAAAAQSRALKKNQLPSLPSTPTTSTSSTPAATTACRLNPTQQSLGCCCLSNTPVCNVPRCNAARTGTVLSSNRDPNFGSYTVVTLDTTAAGAGSGVVVDKTVVQGGHLGSAAGSYGNLGDSDDVGGTVVNAPPPSLNTQPAGAGLSSPGLPGVGAEINRIPEDEPQEQQQDVATATTATTPAAPAQEQQQPQEQAQEKDTLEVTYAESESEQPVPQDGTTASSSASNAADAAEVTVQILPPPQEAAAAGTTASATATPAAATPTTATATTTPAAPALSTSSDPSSSSLNSNPNTLCTIPSFDLATGTGNPAGYECNHDTDCQEGCCAQLGIRTVCLAPDVVARFGGGGGGGNGGLRCRGEPNDCLEINRVRLGLAGAAGGADGLPVDGSGGENAATTTMSAAQAVAGYATSANPAATSTATTTNPQDTTTTTTTNNNSNSNNNNNSKPLDIKIPSIGKPFSRPCQSSSSCQSGMCAVAPNVSGGVCVDSLPGGWKLREEDFGKPNK